jgi:DeoR/GlpR family transcriptional regulator of sugar metabolism
VILLEIIIASSENRHPNSHKLATVLGMSHQTVARKLKILLADGLIRRHDGSYSYVDPLTPIDRVKFSINTACHILTKHKSF